MSLWYSFAFVGGRGESDVIDTAELEAAPRAAKTSPAELFETGVVSFWDRKKYPAEIIPATTRSPIVRYVERCIPLLDFDAAAPLAEEPAPNLKHVRARGHSGHCRLN